MTTLKTAAKETTSSFPERSFKDHCNTKNKFYFTYHMNTEF